MLLCSLINISNCFQKTKTPKLESTELNKTLIEDCFNIYIDTQTLLQRLPQFLLTAEEKVPINNKDLLRQSLKSSGNALESTKEKIRECIVTELYEFFNVQLKQVSDIPRLYRKTNRSVPTKPCVYIDVVTKTLDEFNNNATKRLDNAFLHELYSGLFNIMTVS